jgi:hypothetical protein
MRWVEVDRFDWVEALTMDKEGFVQKGFRQVDGSVIDRHGVIINVHRVWL